MKLSLRRVSHAPHYVRDYLSHVAKLRRQHPEKEAMSLAVGGDYDATGAVLKDIVTYAGLRRGMALLDLGCGSGRLSSQLGGLELTYLGLDVVPSLLQFARKHSPTGFDFKISEDLNVPTQGGAFDVACAFSLFTHLRHEETFLYMCEVARVLRPGGRLVFSFLEFAEPDHWRVFYDTAQAVRTDQLPHLNVFMERNAIGVLASRSGFAVRELIAGGSAPWGSRALGQAVAILEKA